MQILPIHVREIIFVVTLFGFFVGCLHTFMEMETVEQELRSHRPETLENLIPNPSSYMVSILLIGMANMFLGMGLG